MPLPVEDKTADRVRNGSRMGNDIRGTLCNLDLNLGHPLKVDHPGYLHFESHFLDFSDNCGSYKV